MRRLLTTVSNRHESVFKYAMILLAVVLIVIALPKETSFIYDFQKGKPWVYDNLIAPFDFAIVKSETELNAEKANILKNTHPFYRFDELLAEQKSIQLKEELQRSYGSKETTNRKSKFDPDKQYSIASELLRSVYRKGIILKSASSGEKKREEIITLVRKNIAEERSADEFFTVRSAFDHISGRLDSTAGADKQVLAPILENCLAHNITYDDEATRNWTRQLIDQLSLNRGLVQQGEVIILKGEVVDDSRLQKLESLKLEMKNQELTGTSRWMMLLGHFILISLAIGILITFLFLFRREVYDDNARITLLMLLVVSVTYMFLWVLKLDNLDIYIAPVCILPIVVRAFYDTRTALFTHIVSLLILGFQAPNGFEYMFIQTIAGMVAIFTIVTMSRRVQFFISVLMIFLSYSVAFAGIAILHEAGFRSIDWLNLRWFAANSVLTLFAFPLIYLLEKTFGFMSDVSLMELADSNSPLLRELALKAPGTFQHSMQVANLAEEAIFRIGGNPLLVRAGAMYHDIGKADMANYFIENQQNHNNPHDELSFEESARIIKSHVIKGIEKARKAKVPDTIVDFIRTHHGTSRLQYFYQSFLKNFPEKVPDEELFRYPGPLPYSKETTVLMMADSVEAASRSLKTPDASSIEKLVDSIIDHQMESGQYINAPLTLRDIETVRKTFKKMLMSMFHARIDYPE
jgi:putative nucleotidyltransferase with HDIG domain